MGTFLSSTIDTIKNWMPRNKASGAGAMPGALPAEPAVQTPPQTTQLKFSPAEMNALRRHIQECESSAREGTQILKLRWADQAKRWREKVGLEGGEEGKSNFRVQLILALCMSKHAREVEALFGQKAAIKSTPRGPTDTKIAERSGLYMTWQVYENMKALKGISLWMLKRLQHGRSYAFVPWERKSYNRTMDGKTERVVYRSGPEIYPLNNDDIILPVTVEGKAGFDSVQNAEWVIRRYWTTPTAMLMQDNEPGGSQNPEGDWYQGVKGNWKRIVSYAKNGIIRDSERDATAIEVDLAEGVQRDGNSVGSQAGQLEIWEWHGRWRRWAEQETENGDAAMDGQGGQAQAFAPEPPSPDMANAGGADGQTASGMVGRVDNSDSVAMAGGVRPDSMGVDTEGAEYLDQGAEAAELAFSGVDTYHDEALPDGTFRDTDGHLKQMLETDLIVRFVPRMNLIVGIQDASEVYPDSPIKRPIMEMALCNDGQYYSMGLIELSEEIEHEMTVLCNRAIQATEMTIGPPIFYDPSLGESAITRKYEPFDAIPTTNPQGVNQLKITPNVEVLPMMWNLFQSLYERLTGLTDLSMGRGMDQPNAPRTLGGQRLVMGAGDVRLALDMRMLSEDLKPLLSWIWDCCRMFGSEEEFYRVTEGSSMGNFEPTELNGQFARLGAKERNASYDFSLEFADDMQVREGKKQEWLALLPLLLSFPLVQMDPVLQYRLLAAALEAFGKQMADYAPEPPPISQPLRPDVEWTMILEGQDVFINPMDDDALHLKDHEMRVMAMSTVRSEDRDEDAMLKMWDHMQEHLAQQQMKAVAQAVTATMGQMSNAAQIGQAGGHQDPMGMLMQSMQGGRGGANGTAAGGTSNAPSGQGMGGQQAAPPAPGQML